MEVVKIAKNIKIEWCENFIRSQFEKLPGFAKGIERNCFFRKASEAGLYTPETYGSPMSQALGNLTEVKSIQDDNGNYLYSVFYLK